MKRVFGFIIITCMVSCTKNTETKPSFTENEGTVTRISVASSASIGQDVTVTVNYNGAQLCDEAGHIERTQIGKTITIHAYYKHPNTNDPCLDSPALLSQDFTFKPLQTGQFIFRSPVDANISDTLTVL